MGAIDVRAQVVEAQAIDGRVDGGGIETARVEDGNLAPGRYIGRRHVGPSLATIARHVNQTIIGAAPDHVRVFVGRRDRVDDTATRLFSQLWRAEDTDALRHFGSFTR